MFYIDTGANRFYRKRLLYHQRKQEVRYLFSLLLLTVFGNIKLLRKVARALDYALVNDNRLEQYFNKYHPDIIFCPDIAGAVDLSLIRQAKHRGIVTVGIIKAWDNITMAKYPFRLMPDKIICYNKPLQKDVIHHLDMLEENTYVSGIPQFDFYFTRPRASREVFCKQLGISPNKRIILFASIGRVNPTENEVATLLEQAVQEGKIPRDIVIIFRYHPTQNTAIKNLPVSKYFIVDDSKTFIEKQENFSEILEHDMEHLANSLFHADVMITTCSTMAIDGSAINTPIIDLGFDGYKNLPFHKSVRRYYTRHETHYQPIAKKWWYDVQLV